MRNKITEVLFKLNLSKDIDNWWGACNSTFMGVDWKTKAQKNTLKHIVNKPKKESKIFLESYLKKRYSPNNKYIKKFKTEIKDYWKQREKEVFNRIEKITKKPIWPDKIICYYGTFPRGNYKIKKKTAWMILDPKVWHTKEIYCEAMLHEILHFQFHRYFWKDLQNKGLNKKEIHHIKEATTFLINEEFLDLIPYKDYGYKIHQEFRKDLTKEWKRHKNFQKLLDKAVKLLKTKYSTK